MFPSLSLACEAFMGSIATNDWPTIGVPSTKAQGHVVKSEILSNNERQSSSCRVHIWHVRVELPKRFSSKIRGKAKSNEKKKNMATALKQNLDQPVICLLCRTVWKGKVKPPEVAYQYFRRTQRRFYPHYFVKTWPISDKNSDSVNNLQYKLV